MSGSALRLAVELDGEAPPGGLAPRRPRSRPSAHPARRGPGGRRRGERRVHPAHPGRRPAPTRRRARHGRPDRRGGTGRVRRRVDRRRRRRRSRCSADRRPGPLGRLDGRRRLRLARCLSTCGARCRTPTEPPGTAVRRRPGAHPAAQRPGASGDLPGRRLGREAGLRRPRRRCHLLRARRGLRRRARLRRGRPGPPGGRRTAEGDLRILPGTEIIIGATEEEAQEKKRWIRRQQVTPASALGIAGLLWNRDLSDRDVDGPLPKEDPVVVENDGSFGARPRRRSAQGGRRLAGEGRGGRLVAARDRHRARPAVRPCRHPPPASPTGSPPGCGTVPSTGSTSRRT